MNYTVISLTTQGLNDPAPKYMEISRKDADSVGISEGDMPGIAYPLLYSVGASDILINRALDPAAGIPESRPAP
jgi:hypothetical protein